jgi:NAD(P)-dependent dehydrogenase (short-subunit alcohol dehydrogenase family)
MINPFSLQGKVILITGASSGIGKSIAIECSKMEAQLIITARNQERLNDTLKLLEGNNHNQYMADLSTDSGIESLTGMLPKLDGIVHVAGIIKPKPFQFLNRDEIDEIMCINFFGPTLLTNLLIRKKLINKNASLVFISSVSGTMCSFIGGSSYSASKGAINGMIKGMALDLASKQIRVNSIIPGMIETSIFKNSAISEESLIEDRKKYPLGRYGRPEDIAYGAIYLLSDASTWITGSNLLIDGGFTLN